MTSILLITGLCSFKKDDSQPAVPPGSFTAMAFVGYPKIHWLESKNEQGLPLTLAAGAQYQASRLVSAGLQFSYESSATGMLQTKNVFSGTVYQRDRWANWNVLMATVDFCYLNKGSVSLGSGIGLAMELSRYSDHVIDSVGISTYHTYHINGITGRLRLLEAKLKIADNFGINCGLGLGAYSIATVGAHYTFSRRK